MQDVYEELRKRARTKRDSIIRKAQADFRSSLAQINELEQNVGAGGPARDKGTIPKSREVLSVLRSVIPPNREFTIAELKHWAQEAAGRPMADTTVRSAMHRLSVTGVIRRVSRGYKGKVKWIATGGENEPEDFATLRLPEAAARVLAECGPLRDTELATAIQHRGCRADDEPRMMLKSLAKTLRDNPKRFQLGENGRWELQ